MRILIAMVVLLVSSAVLADNLTDSERKEKADVVRSELAHNQMQRRMIIERAKMLNSAMVMLRKERPDASDEDKKEIDKRIDRLKLELQSLRIESLRLSHSRMRLIHEQNRDRAREKEKPPVFKMRTRYKIKNKRFVPIPPHIAATSYYLRDPRTGQYYYVNMHDAGSATPGLRHAPRQPKVLKYDYERYHKYNPVESKSK